MATFEPRCAYCGEGIKNHNTQQKYHKECAVIVHRKSAREHMKRRREFAKLLGINLRNQPHDEAKARNQWQDWGLALAIIMQAVEDWRELCNGKEPTEDCNFEELEEFFLNKNKCDSLLCGHFISSEDIFKQLKQERGY